MVVMIVAVGGGGFSDIDHLGKTLPLIIFFNLKIYSATSVDFTNMLSKRRQSPKNSYYNF